MQAAVLLIIIAVIVAFKFLVSSSVFLIRFRGEF